jgi:hypothetical protein
MPHEGPPIIARASLATSRLVAKIVFTTAAIAGTVAAAHFARLGLTLSHYDARAHLVVARRVFDSLTPGWRQLGALWLPLPHLLNLVPIAWDWNYRTGASAVALSILSLSAGLAALATYVYRYTDSVPAAIVAPLVILANPNLLYLVSTPMTEPLLVGFAFAALLAVDDWIGSPTPRARRRAGWLLVGLVLTRYEGWLIAAGLIAVAFAASGRRGVRAALALAAYPATAVLAFLGFGRASNGAWLVTSGFFVPDNPARHQPVAALVEVMSTTRALAGPVILVMAAIGALVCVVQTRRRSVASWLPLALLASAPLPLAAFEVGHPERVRYMVPLVAACGGLAGLAFAALPRRARGLAAVVFFVVALTARPPLTHDAPVLVEAQWERPLADARREVTRFLATSYDGTPILASMTSLAHYIQETAAIGLNVRNFLHEGNGDLWTDALSSPRRHVRWVLIEEQARGGDGLAVRARQDPSFLAGFARVAEGGGVALYVRRDERDTHASAGARKD